MRPVAVTEYVAARSGPGFGHVRTRVNVVPTTENVSRKVCSEPSGRSCTEFHDVAGNDQRGGQTGRRRGRRGAVRIVGVELGQVVRAGQDCSAGCGGRRALDGFARRLGRGLREHVACTAAVGARLRAGVRRCGITRRRDRRIARGGGVTGAGLGPSSGRTDVGCRAAAGEERCCGCGGCENEGEREQGFSGVHLSEVRAFAPSSSTICAGRRCGRVRTNRQWRDAPTRRTARAASAAPAVSAVVHESIELRDGALRLVVVADTHSEPHPRTAELIRALRPDRILHAGDIGDLDVLRRLSEIAPVTAIRGNIDVHAPDLPDALTLDVRDGAESLFTLLLVHIAVYGPKLCAEAARLARAEHCAIVVCGHSHVPFIGRDRDLAISTRVPSGRGAFTCRSCSACSTSAIGACR